MKVFKAIASVAGKAWAVVVNYYEAARWSFTGERGWIPGGVQDARFDATKADRETIMLKARHFESNDGVSNRLVDLFEQFTAGSSGLQVVPNSSDEKWNMAAGKSWEIFCKFPDLVSRQTFGSLQSMMARRWFVDGEIFIHKTRGDSGKPRVRLYESHQCKTPTDKAEEEGKTVVDGVQINAVGRPIGYWFQKDSKDNTSKGFVLVPAEEIIHLFEPERPGMYRGLSFFYPVMNDLQDLNELQIYEKRAAKDAAEKSIIVKTETGEANPAFLRRAAVTTTSQNTNGDGVTKPAPQWTETSLGARTLFLKNNQDAKVFESNRPTVSQQSFWDYLLARICAGVGISKLLVLPYSMQGTVTRSDLDIASVFFRSRSAVLAAAVLEIYVYYMGFAMQFDPNLGRPPADWFQASIRPPRAVNVDTGRNSSAMIAEFQAGLRTAQDIFGECGEDWRQQLRQRAIEAAYVQDLLTEFDGITKEDICNPTGAAAAPMTPEPDTKEENAQAV